MKVVIKGAGSAIIKDLKVGKYTVTEDTDWSWRYGPADNSATVQVKGGVVNTVEITNTRQATEYWLDGSAYAENKLPDTGAGSRLDDGGEQ